MKELNFDQETPIAGPDKEARAVARKAKDAARKRIERMIANPSPVPAFWEKAERAFALADPDQWHNLAIRDCEVADTEAELQAAMTAFDRGLPIRDFIDVNLDQVYDEINLDVRKYGALSYPTIEATLGSSEGYKDFRSSKYDGTPESAYRCFGLKLCLNSDVLGAARDLLIVYALTTNDQSLNQIVVEDAIKHSGSFSHYSEQVRNLLFKTRQVELSPEQAIKSRQGDSVEMTQKQLEALQYKRWAEIAYGKGGIFEGDKR